MNEYIFYSDIRNQMATELLKHPKHIDKIHDVLSGQTEHENIITFCHDAARIFHAIGDLSQYKDLSTHSVEMVTRYTHNIVEKLINDEKPLIIDLIMLSAETIGQFC